MPTHVVEQRECMSSIAALYGFTSDTIWMHPQNARLKAKRKDPNVLFPGDKLAIPEKTVNVESCATGARHRFRRKGVPVTVRIRLLDRFGKPRRNLPCRLVIDEKFSDATTDGRGQLKITVSPDAKTGKIIIGTDGEEIDLNFGHLDPITEVSGVQARLANLGIDCGPIDGVMSPQTQKALQAFQRQSGLAETGKLDDATRDKLKERYGC